MTQMTTTVDLGWFKSHLLDEILPKWQASITDQGLFLSHFDRKWQPLHRNYGTLVSQCRLLYNFAQGYALTGDPLYQNAVTKGANFLLEHFRDHKYGGWYWSCGLDGQVLDNHKNGYGHAFTLFGLAHSYKCTGEPALQAAMYDTWEVLHKHFSDQHGGYLWRMTEGFESAEPTRSQNPTMHLFEALLTGATVGGATDLFKQARAVGDFVLHKLVRPSDRRLPEVFDADWAELPMEDDEAQPRMTQTRGGRLDIGHAFEWAFLTSYAAELGFPAYYRNYANSFMTYGLAIGLDWEAGGIYSPSTPTGQLMNQRKGWWEQCEAIRALINFVVLHQRNDLLEPLQKMIGFMQTTMIDPEYGGWYPNVGPGYTPTELEKGNEWKLDYHVVGMCMEAIRMADRPLRNE